MDKSVWLQIKVSDLGLHYEALKKTLNSDKRRISFLISR